MPNANDQMRQLTNKVVLAGIITALDEAKEGVTTSGVPYISFAGRIRVGESGACEIPFRTFIKSKKSDGSDSKSFANAKSWYEEAHALAPNEDESNGTWVELQGSLTDNPYVSRDGKLVEGTQYNMQFFNKFEEYKAEVNLEGFINNIAPETDPKNDGEETGRLKVRLITRDYFNNALDLKNLYVDRDLASAFEEVYSKGQTATLFITLTPHTVVKKVEKGGFGVQRNLDSTRSYMEMIITGGGQPVDEDSNLALDPRTVKAAMDVRKAHLVEVESKGYQGSNGTSASTRTSGFGTAPKTSTSSNKGFVDIDEDIPF